MEGKKITDLIHQGLLYVLDEEKTSKQKTNTPKSLTYKPIDRSKGKKLFASLSTEEYIQKCVELSPQERLDWLEEYKLLIPISAYDERIEEVQRSYNANSK